MGLIENAKAAYVAGQIAVEELDRRIGYALGIEVDPLAAVRGGWNSADEMRAMWEQAHAGPQSAHRMFVLPAGATFTQIGEMTTDAPSGVIVLH